MKVSLVIPSIRPSNWPTLVADMKLSCQKHEHEVIFVGPYLPPVELMELSNVKYIKDLGCPSRCLQIGSLFAEGQYLAWCSDDCRIEADAFDESLELFDTQLSENDGMNMLYSEGANFSGNQHEDPSYWIARTHTDLRLEGVLDGWKIAPIFMYRLKLFRQMGGLDCSFEHVNQNTHDLAFAVQSRGGVIADSPRRVFRFDWQPQKPDYPPILAAFMLNDRPLFSQRYSIANAAASRYVDYDNWRKQPSVWKRRFK